MPKLTVKGVEKAPAGRHGDGGGLYLLVKPTGARSWLLRIQVDGRRRDVGLGSIAKLSLAEARDEAAKLRKHALNGRDPIVERDRKEHPPVTFRIAMEAAHKAKAAGWADKTASAFLSSLTEHALPALGDLLVSEIEAHHVAAALGPIWTAKPAVAAKVRHRIGVVLTYAHAMRWRASEAPVRTVSALLSSQPEGGNRPAMPWREVPAYIADLQGKAETVSRLALMFLIATGARSREVRLSTWSEVDAVGRLWNRPAAHMKGRNAKAHTVTLNDFALSILERAKEHRKGRAGDALIFPSAKGLPLSDMTISKLMRDAGLAYVPHGFRSSFRDWAADEMAHIPDPVAESAIAHVVSDKVIAAYKRTDFLAMRRALLDGWGAFLKP